MAIAKEEKRVQELKSENSNLETELRGYRIM
jgi:hypothetical protein